MKKLRKKLQVESIDETAKVDELKKCLIRAAEDDSFNYDGDEAVRSVENFYSIRIVEKGNQPRLSNIKGFDKAFETYDWVYLIEGEKAERGSGESELSFWSADEALEKNYKVIAHGWEDRMTMYWIVVDKDDEMLNENQKVTLTIGQLKRLVRESDDNGDDSRLSELKKAVRDIFGFWLNNVTISNDTFTVGNIRFRVDPSESQPWNAIIVDTPVTVNGPLSDQTNAYIVARFMLTDRGSLKRIVDLFK